MFTIMGFVCEHILHYQGRTKTAGPTNPNMFSFLPFYRKSLLSPNIGKEKFIDFSWHKLCREKKTLLEKKI